VKIAIIDGYLKEKMIRKSIMFVSLICICFVAKGQAVHGNVDSSFSTYSAYNKAVKKHPGISIAAKIHSSEVKEEKGIVYCDLNGRKLLLDVFSPADNNKANNIAIIIIHGGGWRSGNRMQHYPLAQQLAQLGYTCFTIEYRLSTEALYPVAIFDSKAAVKWVRKNALDYNIDTEKITALGFSAGGEIAAFIGTTGNEIKFEEKECNADMSSAVNAVIDIDGTLSFVHPENSEGNDSKKLSAATQWFGVAKKDSFKLWKEASPLTHVNKNTPPTLFINSSVAAMHAGREDYLKVLKEHNIYSEVHSFENSPHTFCLFHPWFELTVNYIDIFLKKVFKTSVEGNKKTGAVTPVL
jgi:acetyl esterase/lipase